MGRWLKQLREREKIVETLEAGTLKTLETPQMEVLKVLSVPQRGIIKNFSSAPSEQSAPAHGDASLPSDESWGVLFDERAGFLEYDEGLSRAEAEQLAREQIGCSALREETSGRTQHVRLPDAASDQSADKLDEGASRHHLVTFVPVTGPGVVVGATPAVALSSVKYDAVLDRLIAATDDAIEVARLQRAKAKGNVVSDGERKVFMRGRL